jgi:hypothetical protein
MRDVLSVIHRPWPSSGAAWHRQSFHISNIIILGLTTLCVCQPCTMPFGGRAN